LAGKQGLLRSLGLIPTTAILVCSIVGQGVFLKARVMMCNVGTPGSLLAAWVVAGLLTLCGALTFAELGAAIPASGGPYAFLRRAYGRPLAFAGGWSTFFIGGPASTAALAAGCAIFFNLASGNALERVGSSAASAGTPLNVTGMQWAAVILIVAVTALNFAPALLGGRIATLFAYLKIGMLAALTLAAIGLGHGSLANFSHSATTGSCAGVLPAMRLGPGGFAAALSGALYAYGGWQNVTQVAGEVKNPGDTFPFALGAGVVLVIVAYVAANASYVYVLGPLAITDLPAGASVGVTMVEALFGPALSTIAASLLFASVAATLHVTILTYSRVTYALAKDGYGPSRLAGLSSRARVPVDAMVANALIAIALVLLGNFDTLSNYFVFNAWLFFVATAAALFVLRRREPELARPYRVFGYPYVPAVFIIVSSWMLVQTLLSDPYGALAGVAIVALSFPYYYWERSRGIRKSMPLP
jgi:APA family basic amino acid/polyamine antiporter